MRRVTAALSSLIVVCAALAGIGLLAASPASAYAECSVTKTGGAAPISKGTGVSSLDLPVRSKASGILSLAITIDVSYPRHKDLTISLVGPGNRTDLFQGGGNLGLGGGDADFTRTRFKDSAPTPIAKGKSPRTGTFKPSGALESFVDTPARGTWRLQVSKAAWLMPGQSGRINSWTLTVRYDCDTDGDDVPDTKDNCPEVANPDQADGDRDGIGNACDADPDSDGVPPELDNCPVHHNPGQQDSDGDGDGDACDEDPDNDGFEAGDRCPLAQAWTDTGCPKAKRASTITYLKAKRLFRGRVTSPNRTACAARQPLYLMRVTAKGPNKRVGSIRTNARGVWTLGRNGRVPARYYVMSPDVFKPKVQCVTFRAKNVVIPQR